MILPLSLTKSSLKCFVFVIPRVVFVEHCTLWIVVQRFCVPFSISHVPSLIMLFHSTHHMLQRIIDLLYICVRSSTLDFKFNWHYLGYTFSIFFGITSVETAEKLRTFMAKRFGLIFVNF